MTVTLTGSALFRKHNAEIFIQENIMEKLHFINTVPISANDTGEFATVIGNPEGIEIVEPEDAGEESELTEIELKPIDAVLGNTHAKGFKIRFSRQAVNRSKEQALMEAKLKEVASGMTQYLNQEFLKGMVAGAGAKFPTGLSDWNDLDAIDPLMDAIDMRKAYKTKGKGFKLTQSFIAEDRFTNLEKYWQSMDWKYDGSEGIDVNGTLFINAEDSFDGVVNSKKDPINCLNIDKDTPAGVMELCIEKEFSTYQTAKLRNPKNTKLPPALFNINEFALNEYPYTKGYDIWVDCGYSTHEPSGISAGWL